MPNAQDPNFNKNVSMVYVEEAGFTGYKGFDFTKIDDIENILRAGVAITGATTITVNVNSGNLNVNNEVEVTNTVGNPLPISGYVFVSNFPQTQTVSGTQGVTGSVSITNFPSIQGVTGSVTVTNLSGSFDSSTANNYLSGILNTLTIQKTGTINNYVSGIFSEVTNIDNKLFITGDPSPAGVQGTIVFQADLTQQFDAVTNFPEQSSGINNFNADTSNGTVLNENIYRRELFIQNLATGVLYVKYGAQANISNFNFILAANTSTNAGDGGSLSDQGYNGVVSVSGINGINSPRYIAWERTNINKTPLI